jgi:hypothetical protein
MRSTYAKENARRALATEGQIDPKNTYAQEKGQIRRQIDQLSLGGKSKNNIFVYDLAEQHGRAVTRTIAGKTGLAQGANISTESPRGTAYADNKKTQFEQGKKGDPSADQLVQDGTLGFIRYTGDAAVAVRDTRLQTASKGDGSKTFMNLSHGLSPNNVADRIAGQMLSADKGSQLYREATKVLGHEPKRRVDENGRPQLDPADRDKLKKDLIYPKLKTQMDTPEFKQAMSFSRSFLESEVAQAKKQGVMVLQAAGNDHQLAQAAGDPKMSQNITNPVKGIFHVGATDSKGVGTGDDVVAPFSSSGQVDASAAGVGIPVDVKDGKAVEQSGTSLATPVMTETAWAISRSNPKLSVDQIEGVLKDPRVARDLLPGNDRDGAGVVDQFAAVVVAKAPNVTRARIEEIRTTLDANPSARYQLLSDGALRQLD